MSSYFFNLRNLLYLTELDGLVSYESFRDGFILGARLMMEVACGQGRFSEGD